MTLTGAKSDVGDVALMNSVQPATTVIGDPESTVLVSVEDATTTEGEPAMLIVRLSGKSSGNVTVPFDVGGGTATLSGQDIDYTDPNEDVVIPAGMTTGTITVSTMEDQIAEDTETFTVTLTTLTDPPAGVRLGDETATVTIRDDNPLTVTVTGDGRVREGDEATFTVELDGGMGSKPIVVDYTVGGTATEGIDYTKPEGTLTINPEGNLERVSETIPIQTRQDSEADETLVVTLTGVRTEAGRVTLGTPSAARSTLVVQETVIITVADATPTEAQSATFGVTVSGALSGTVKLSYETAPGTASAADYTTTSNTIDVAAADNDAITIDITNDELAEGDETFMLNLSLVGAPDNVLLGSTSASARITDDDELSVSVAREEATVEEGSDAHFPVTLAGRSTADVVVKYTVAGDDNNGADPADKEDFEVPGDSITIPAGANSATIVIPIAADDLLEPNERLQVTLMSATTAKGSFADPVVTGGAATTEIIPQAQDQVTVSLVETAVTVTEGGKALFPVVLSGEVAGDLTVVYTIEAGATNGATETGDNPDFSTATPRQVVIKEGDTRATIEVNTTPDTQAENNETFTVTLTAPTRTGVSLGTPQATGTITDNDRLAVTVEGSDRVAAGQDGTYRFRLTGGTTGSADITVAYTTNGTAGTPETIDAGDSVSAPDFTVSSSGLSEGDRLVVRITSVTTSAGTVSSGVGREKSIQIMHADTATVSIGDDDEAPEGSDAEFRLTVTGSPTGPLTVTYQVSAGSASTADFMTPSARSVVLTSSSGEIRVPVEPDDVAEGDETFTVRLTGVRSETDTDQVVLGTTTGTATIPENDSLTAEIESQDTTVLEGDSATFVVDLGGTSSRSVEIDYTVSGDSGATDPAEEEDFSPAKGKLTIPAGRRTGTIQVEAIDDDILEPNETLEVMLSGAAPANVVTVDGDKDSATTVIGASDSPARVSVADVTVDEGETAMIEVKLSKEVSSQVSVTFELAPQPGADYGGPTPASPLVFMLGDKAKTIEVATTQDTLAEDEETFTVTLVTLALSPQVAGVSLGRSEATVTITDDALRATIEGPASVNEGDDAVYTVTVTGGTFGTDEDDQVTVTWSTEDSSATPNDDFMPASGTLVIGAEEPSATFTIGTVDDDIPELGEIIDVSLTAESVVDGETEAVGTGSPARTIIVDNDGAVEVLIVADQEVVVERQPATFTVELTGAVAEALTLRYATVDGTATAGTDFRAAAGDATVEIPAGQMSATITVATLPDDEDEIPDETFSVSLLDDGLPEDVAIDTRTARVRITDHEIRASVTAEQATVTEGSPVVFTVRLTVDGNAAGALNRTGVEVDYAIGGNVTAADYREASTGTVTFLPDEDEATITITTRDDDGLDRGETLTLSLTDATSLQNQGLAVVNPTAGAASTMISDGGSVTWSVADISVGEDEPAIFTVILSGLVQDDVTLSYGTRDGTAMAGTDYTAMLNRTVTVTGGNREATFTVATIDDSQGEANETFTVELRMSGAIAGVGPPSDTARAEIRDDDIVLRPVDAVTITEGETRTIPLALEQALRAPVTVRYTAGPGTTVDTNDFSIALPPSAPQPDAQGTFTLPIGFQAGRSW